MRFGLIGKGARSTPDKPSSNLPPAPMVYECRKGGLESSSRRCPPIIHSLTVALRTDTFRHATRVRTVLPLVRLQRLSWMASGKAGSENAARKEWSY